MQENPFSTEFTGALTFDEAAKLWLDTRIVAPREGHMSPRYIRRTTEKDFAAGSGPWVCSFLGVSSPMWSAAILTIVFQAAFLFELHSPQAVSETLWSLFVVSVVCLIVFLYARSTLASIKSGEADCLALAPAFINPAPENQWLWTAGTPCFCRGGP
jgi:hypothetical protein